MLKFNVLFSIYEFEQIQNSEMKKRKTKVIWTESQNDIHVDFGHTKLNGKIETFMITISNSEESINFLKIT
jgi:hypothetical protein